jgi:hypothetical protein
MTLPFFVDVLQRDWDAHIAQLEFAYNNTINDSIGQTPFLRCIRSTTSDFVRYSPPSTVCAVRQCEYHCQTLCVGGSTGYEHTSTGVDGC